MIDVLTHPEAAQPVDALVAAGGGLVDYGLGAPGRQVAVAAGARLAADSGASLTVVDVRHMLPQIRSVLQELYPRLACAVISAHEAAEQPPRTEGVLVVHTDLLLAPGVREALLDMARTADHLVLAGGEDFDASVLENRALPRFVSQPSDPTPPVPHEPARPHPAAPQPRGSAEGWRAAPAGEREQRLRRQSRPQPMSEQDAAAYAELADLIQKTDPDQLRARIEEMRERHRQRGADYPAPALGSGRPAAHDRAQQQTAVYEQQRPQGLGRA
ncbi:hypothetical protein [Streptomyces sp. NPDC048192]|uniref:hypothetical protein n=1 Tax=Streptomyces sp. NPDC048192 TaxID=3365510 RepID=UPI003720982C